MDTRSSGPTVIIIITSPEKLYDNTETSEESSGAVILDGTSVGSEGNEARDATVGKDDGVFGAPKLDGFEFKEWTHEFVQSHLNDGWTMEQLQSKYEQEFGE